MADEQPTEVSFRLGEDISPGGTFSNGAVVWHTEHEFTIDFAVMPAAPPAPEAEAVEAVVVSRIKMPTSVIFALARAISENVDKYEQQYGQLTPPSND